MDNIQSFKYKAFSEMASSVAHEMKNPLSAITLGLEYLQLGNAEASAQKDVIFNLSSAVVRLNDMLENLHLFFSDENESTKRTPLKASDVLGKTRGLMNYHLTRNHVSLEINATGDEPWLIGNEGQMMTLFFLVVVCLIKRAEGGGRIIFRLGRENGSLLVRAGTEGGAGGEGPAGPAAGDGQAVEALARLASANGWRIVFAGPDDETAAVSLSFPVETAHLPEEKDGKWARY